MLQKHLDVARILQPSGCMGFPYSTNEKELAHLLSERIHALGEKGSVRLFVRTFRGRRFLPAPKVTQPGARVDIVVT